MKSHDTQRFEARLPADKKAFLKLAADLTGRNLTDFVVNSAYEAALRVIKEHEQITLSLKDRDLFLAALLDAPEPSSALRKAAKKYNKDVTDK